MAAATKITRRPFVVEESLLRIAITQDTTDNTFYIQPERLSEMLNDPLRDFKISGSRKKKAYFRAQAARADCRLLRVRRGRRSYGDFAFAANAFARVRRRLRQAFAVRLGRQYAKRSADSHLSGYNRRHDHRKRLLAFSCNADKIELAATPLAVERPRAGKSITQIFTHTHTFHICARLQVVEAVAKVQPATKKANDEHSPTNANDEADALLR